MGFNRYLLALVSSIHSIFFLQQHLNFLLEHPSRSWKCGAEADISSCWHQHIRLHWIWVLWYEARTSMQALIPLVLCEWNWEAVLANKMSGFTSIVSAFPAILDLAQPQELTATPLFIKDAFQDPQWMPETTENTESYIFLLYIPMM